MIVLSCGHKTDTFLNCHDIMMKESSRDGSKAIAYKSVCPNCKVDYEKENLIFNDSKEAEAWLKKEEW